MKRRKNGDDMGSLDSLLDTMTNVAGILIIVLVVTTLNVRDTVNRVRSTLPEVSDAEVDAMQQEAVSASTELETIQEQIADVTPKIENAEPKIEDLRAKAAELREKQPISPDMKKAAAELEQLRLKIAEAKQAAANQKTALAKVEGELVAVKIKLKNRPEVAAPEPKVVRMPDPRPAPEGGVPEYFLCRNERVLHCDVEGIFEKAREAIFANAKALAADGIVDEKDVKRTEFDGPKLVAFFKKRDLGNELFNVALRAFPDRTYALLDFTPKSPELGDTIRQMANTESKYYALVRQAKWKKKFAQYIVAPDGFEVYLAARRIAERSGLPAGWHPHTSEAWTKGLPGVRIKLINEPPPPPPVDPNAKPTPPPPPKPKPPNELID
jgi:hypothetical protein